MQKSPGADSKAVREQRAPTARLLQSVETLRRKREQGHAELSPPIPKIQPEVGTHLSPRNQGNARINNDHSILLLILTEEMFAQAQLRKAATLILKSVNKLHFLYTDFTSQEDFVSHLPYTKIVISKPS